MSRFLLSPLNQRTVPSRRFRQLGLTTLALAGALAFSPVAPAAPATAAPATASGCGWNASTTTDHAYYEHCDSSTNVWILVKRNIRGNYHRCVGPGRTVLDSDAYAAWYNGSPPRGSHGRHRQGERLRGEGWRPGERWRALECPT